MSNFNNNGLGDGGLQKFIEKQSTPSNSEEGEQPMKEESVQTAIDMIIKGSRIIANPDKPFEDGFELIKIYIDDIPKRYKATYAKQKEMTDLDYATVMALADSPHIQAFKDKLKLKGYTLTKK